MDNINLLDDKNLYEHCLKRFLSGHGYASIIQYLKHNGVKEARIKKIVRQLDEYEKQNTVEEFDEKDAAKKPFSILKLVVGIISIITGVVLVNRGFSGSFLVIIPTTIFFIGVILIIRQVSALVDKFMD